MPKLATVNALQSPRVPVCRGWALLDQPEEAEEAGVVLLGAVATGVVVAPGVVVALLGVAAAGVAPLVLAFARACWALYAATAWEVTLVSRVWTVPMVVSDVP